MTRTLTDLISIVRFRGDYRNVVRFPAANLGNEIQAAFCEYYELVDETHEGYWDTTDTVSTAADLAYIPLPSDAWRVKGIDRMDGGTDPVELDQIGLNERNRYSNRTDMPRAYRLTARGADLYPTPNAAYTLRITYTPVAPVLDETARSFYNDWHEYVVYAALVRLALNEQRDSSQWDRQLAFQRERITRGAAKRRSQEPEYIPLRDGYSETRDDEVWR